jgi:hypothetical protein
MQRGFALNDCRRQRSTVGIPANDAGFDVKKLHGMTLRFGWERPWRLFMPPRL